MKTSRQFRATKPRTKDLTDNQRIIRDHTSFGIYLDAIGDKTLSLYYFAGVYKKYNEENDDNFKMPSREEFGFALLRLVQEGLLEMV